MEIPNKLKVDGINFVLLERSGKKPFEKGWQTKTIPWNDKNLKRHLDNGGNYGVRGGGEKNLIIIDFDNEEVQKEVVKVLPETFTVKTGSGLLHKYFLTNNNNSFKIFSENMDTIADIQAEGKQVVGAGSIHPNGNIYELVDNKDIAFIDYAELKAILTPYDKKPKRKKNKVEINLNIGDDFIDNIKSRVSFESILSEFGVDTSRSPTNCPLHSSKGGKCFGWNDETAHCFHCDGSWNLFSFIKDMKDIDFKEVLEWLAEKEGLEDELKENRKNWKRKNSIKVMNNKASQVKMFAEAQPYFYDKNKLWWLWDEYEYKWELVDEVDILNMISSNCNQDVISSKARTETLNALKQEGRKYIPNPVKPTWIQFKNKIIDITTGKEFNATSEYFVTNPIPWKLGEYPDTPNIDRIFRDWVGEENLEILYEILAYSILPDMPLHRIFCFIGGGMNGKSKFLELLRKFVGGNNCCSTELDTLLTSRFEVTRLHKKLVCQMGETNFNEMSKTSLLKKLSGGDLIGFEYKNKNPFEEKNYAKILIATNNLPSTTDKTIGFYRRWTIIDFPNSFTEKKDILGEIPREEYESLALRSVVTLRSLLDKREFTNEGTVEERMERYESRSNFLDKFLQLFTTQENIDGYITKSDFYKKFMSWCKENKHRILSDRSLGASMKKIGVETGRKAFEWMNDGRGGQARVWLGLLWKD